MNEIHEKHIDNDFNEPVPEYDTAIEHLEESNNEGEVTEVDGLKKGLIESDEDNLDLKKQMKLLKI